MNYGMALKIFMRIICFLVSIAHSLVNDVFIKVLPGVRHNTPKNPCFFSEISFTALLFTPFKVSKFF